MSSASMTAVLILVVRSGLGVTSEQIPYKDFDACEKNKDSKLERLAKDLNDDRFAIRGGCLDLR